MAPVYLRLVGTCGGLYFVDLWCSYRTAVRDACAVVGGVTCLPMLFSGIVFARSFVAAEQREAAFGANLIGALAGGLLQSVTFLTGTQALLLIVAGLYAALGLLKSHFAADPLSVDYRMTRTVEFCPELGREWG